jgi:putative hydrolase of the HAD superfamily
MEAPEAVLFDLGGTVLRQESFHPERWAETLLPLVPGSVTPSAVRELTVQLVREFRPPTRRGLVEVRMEACLRHLHERLGVVPTGTGAEVEQAFWETTSRMAPEPGVAAVLEGLRLRGVHAAMVSNSMFRREVLEGELGRHGLAEYFRFVMSSADYGLRKPHPSLFRTALARLGLPAEKVLFVGDSFANDVVGASGVGMRTAWYNPTGAAPGEGRADFVLKHWDEFVELLGAAAARLLPLVADG